ncbi:hypothetical protein ABNN70_01950 [Sporolactobacillus sp. Y61]|jgi:hypothetical protein|uniref:YmcC n=1 Tax=Sporolactobacillus sp. Y61 TaxID=3160863 RepID=A0AAU8IG79_9BACL|nr:hypothetical protein [Sporolactobacillus sp. THM19-2]RYL92648.1 hypothetical protein EWH91_07255 [Sporolactobacillus sp. THM19-2]
MIYWFIIADEISFWLFILLGLITRYIMKKEKLSLFFFISTPFLDLLLLILTFFDLRSGHPASFAHALAAIYIGVSIAFGSQMVKWADVRFAHHFAGGPAPAKKPKFGKAHARWERQGWYRHLLAWFIGSGLMLVVYFLSGHPDQNEVLFKTARLWLIILAADFIISFSYTLFPKKDAQKSTW